MEKFIWIIAGVPEHLSQFKAKDFHHWKVIYRESNTAKDQHEQVQL